MSEIKLLPCPFCGGEAKICDEDFLKGRFVFCTECGIQTKLYVRGNTIEQSVSAWNTRKPMERIVERLEESADQCIKIGDVYGFSATNEAISVVKEEGGIE